MSIESVSVGRSYLMDDDRILKIYRQWHSEDGHQRVAFSVIKGEPVGYLDMSLREFTIRAIREI